MKGVSCPLVNSEAELRCVGCGYDLRGLESQGVCPECATPIERSVAGNLLAYADPEWVARVAKGQRHVSLGINLTLFGLLVGILLMLAAGLAMAFLDFDLGVFETVILFILRGVMLTGLIVASIGGFLVTTPDPREREREQLVSTRICARSGMVAAIGLVVLGEVFDSVPMMTADLISSVLTFLGFIAFTVGLVSILTWLAILAVRIPDEGLAKSARDVARFMRWALPVVLVFGLLNQFKPAAGPPPQDLLAEVIEALRVAFGCRTVFRDC